MEEEEEAEEELSHRQRTLIMAVTRYSLDDYMEVEEMLKSSQPSESQKHGN